MLNDDINRFLGIFSFPLSSLDFVENDLLYQYCYALYDTDNKEQCSELEDYKIQFRHQTVQYVRCRYSIYSYDEVYLYLDKWYLYNTKERFQSLKKDCAYSYEIFMDLLKKLSKSLISQRDGKIIYKYWENENDPNLLGGFSGSNKIYLFHSINRLIPLDILAIIYLIDNNNTSNHVLNNFYGNIHVSDGLLDNILDKGVAENHLHSGVSCSFLNFWDGLMDILNEKKWSILKKLELFNSDNIEDNQLKFYILSAGIIRITIILKLLNVSLPAAVEEFVIFFTHPKNPENLYHILTKDDSIANYFISLWNDLSIQSPTVFSGGAGLMKNILESSNCKTSDENLFLFKTLLCLSEKDDTNDVIVIKNLFIQYLRIKNYCFNLTVQQKTIVGLDYFQMQYYKNNSKANKSSFSKENNSFWERAIREQLQNTALRKVEFRCSIDDKYSRFERDVKDFIRAYLKILKDDYCVLQENKYISIKTFPRVGLVFHLLKREDTTFPEKCFNYGNDHDNHLHFQSLQNSYLVKIEMLKELRRKHPFLNQFLVGIDVASLENSVPTWVFAPVYEKARDSSDEQLILINGEPTQSLRFTFHAGEDFRHILSGLRRIDEAVQFLKFHAGDRIGHGIALGIQPRHWFSSNNTVIIPRIEALENYLWAYNLFSNYQSNDERVNLAYMEKKIYTLAKDIYTNMEGLSTEILIDAYKSMFLNKTPINDMFCNSSACGNNKETICTEFAASSQNQENKSWNTNRLCFARNCKTYLLKMYEPVHFRITEEDLSIIEQAQKIVKYKINQAGVVIEVNPSSNVAISDIDTLSYNQVYSLNNCSYDLENVIVSINSDDPSVFNTNVSNELAYIYYGMIDKNASREDILLWIDKLRQNGMDSSFIKQKCSDEKLMIDLIEFCENN